MANPLVGRLAGLAPPTRDPLSFHRRLPGYRATPLVAAPGLAERLGLAGLLVKHESDRLGLPSFKMLGASWATYRALCAHLGKEPGTWRDTAELAGLLADLRPFALAAATDGNHGRAVARMARLLGFEARIFVPEGTVTARVDAIASEGAEVVVVPGDYDDAVATSAREERPGCLVISDTSWPGYDAVPRWVIEGYSTMFFEIDDALAAAGRSAPDVVVVPVGVGALAAAAVAHYRSKAGAGPLIVGVEPSDAACVTASVVAGRPVAVPGPHRSIMAGLNCGNPSPVAWPLVSGGVDGFVTVDDDWARDGVRDLAAVGLEAGETGAAALAGLAALLRLGGPSGFAPSLGPDSTVLVMCTEAATDPVEWRRILGVELVGPGGPPDAGTPAPDTATTGAATTGVGVGGPPRDRVPDGSVAAGQPVAGGSAPAPA